MTASIVGWAHTPFGKLDQETVESLIVRVATDALADAGVGPGDVDEIFLGHFNAGFSQQDFTASLVLQAIDNGDVICDGGTAHIENPCQFRIFHLHPFRGLAGQLHRADHMHGYAGGADRMAFRF